MPDGLGVRIPGFHPGGPGSIPGLGDFFVNIFISATIEFNTRKVIAARGTSTEGAREESSYYGFIS